MGEIYQSITLQGMKGNTARVKALVDTGANINAVSYQFAKKFYRKDEIESAKKRRLHFTSKKSELYPVIFLNVIVRGESRVFPFAVIKGGLGTPVMLGVRYFEDTNMAIDFKQDKIRFRKLSSRKRSWL